MSDSSFLSQLEQRTQQVKITLANLEAERAKIEGMIAALTPLVPHYDALVAAERTLLNSNVELEGAPAPAPSPADAPPVQNSWGSYQQQAEQPRPWNS